MTTWTAPATAAPGGLTSAYLNTNVRDNPNYLKEVVGGTNADKIPNAALASIQDALLAAGITATKLLAVPGAQAYTASSFVVLNATDTGLLFASEYYDTDGMHDNAGATYARNIMHITTAGTYTLGALIPWPDNGTGRRIVKISSTNIGLVANQTIVPTSGDLTWQACSIVRSFAAGDNVAYNIHQTSGGSLTVDALNFPCNFWAIRLSA